MTLQLHQFRTFTREFSRAAPFFFMMRTENRSHHLGVYWRLEAAVRPRNPLVYEAEVPSSDRSVGPNLIRDYVNNGCVIGFLLHVQGWRPSETQWPDKRERRDSESNSLIAAIVIQGNPDYGGFWFLIKKKLQSYHDESLCGFLRDQSTHCTKFHNDRFRTLTQIEQEKQRNHAW
jgi:hypothetical protein